MSGAACEDAFVINEALLPNHTYYLRIWSAFTGADFQGNFKIVVYENTTKKRVSNDECFRAKTLNVGNGACVERVLWQTEGATDSRFDFQSAPYPSSDPNLMYQGRDVWYKFRMPASGDLIINGLLGDFSCPYNIVMNFYTGGCGTFEDRGWAAYFSGFSHTLSTADFAPGGTKCLFRCYSCGDYFKSR